MKQKVMVVLFSFFATFCFVATLNIFTFHCEGHWFYVYSSGEAFKTKTKTQTDVNFSLFSLMIINRGKLGNASIRLSYVIMTSSVSN